MLRILHAHSAAGLRRTCLPYPGQMKPVLKITISLRSVKSITAILVFLFYNHRRFLVPTGQFCALLNTCFFKPALAKEDPALQHIPLWSIQRNRSGCEAISPWHHMWLCPKHTSPWQGPIPPGARVKKFLPWMLCRKRNNLTS